MLVMKRAIGLLALLLLGAMMHSAPARGDLEAAFAARADGSSLRALWLEARRLESDDELGASAERFERLAGALPGETEPLWRLARVQWRSGERMSPEDKAARLVVFRRAEEAARRSAALDPRCAECLFWQAAALGRITTTLGVLHAAQTAPVIAELLARALALRPAHRENDDDTTLGNLYLASASFYRLLPEWRWLSWVLGVRGDRERSVDYSRRAVAISPRRLDYQVELGAGLLCLAARDDREELLREGLAVLRHSQSLAPFAEARLDMTYAQRLIEQPERACSYARDGWIEIDEGSVRAAAAAAGR